MEATTPTPTETNRALVGQVFAALAQGDGRPFVDALADDVRWTLTGSTAWSRTYDGKRAVRDELLRPLFDQFDGTYRNRLQRLLAEHGHRAGRTRACRPGRTRVTPATPGAGPDTG